MEIPRDHLELCAVFFLDFVVGNQVFEDVCGISSLKTRRFYLRKTPTTRVVLTMIHRNHRQKARQHNSHMLIVNLQSERST